MSNNESEFELGWFSKLFIAIIRIMIVAWFFANLKHGDISAIIGSIIFGVIAFYITVWVSNKLKKSISRNYQKLSDVDVVALLMKYKYFVSKNSKITFEYEY